VVTAVPDLAEPGDPGPLQPAQHVNPDIGPVLGWAAGDMPEWLYVGDDYTETDQFPLVANGPGT
jgi:hypothetical protein